MFPAASAQLAPRSVPFGRSLDQPSAYSPIPQRLITDLHDNVLAIGLYGFIARLYLVAQSPIPLSVPDVLRYDPALSRGAVLRALARLIAGGWLIEAAQPGLKTRYTPAWGRVGGALLPWNMAQPCLGRPRHVARLRLDRRLFDICMGKLTLHETRAALITRYVTAPVLSLADVGCYALTLAGLPRATPALIRLGAVLDGVARPLPSDQRLLALISQRALDLSEDANIDVGLANVRLTDVRLTISGTRKLGVQPLLAPEADIATAQPLFFVPKELIGSLIRPLIGSMIGSDAANSFTATATASDEIRSDGHSATITWESRDYRDKTTPPPTPPHHEASSGGGAEAVEMKAAGRRLPPTIQPLPDTETAAALQAINVKPAQIAELAHMPLPTVEAAIADGRARPGVRDLAGWVVSLLRTHRDYGWKIMPPTPAPDSPEALRAAFARYAAEQEAALGVEPIQTQISYVSECAGDDDRSPASSAWPSLAELWHDIQAAIRMRVTRREFTAWIQPAVLRSVEHGIAIISVPGVRMKDGLEQRYTALLRELLIQRLGEPIQVRVTIHDELSVALVHLDATSGPRLLTDVLTATVAPSILAPGDHPHWISADDWIALPGMLRAALIGSTMMEGTVQAISPHLTRLIKTRYAREVAMLVAAAPEMDHANGPLTVSAQHLDPPSVAQSDRSGCSIAEPIIGYPAGIGSAMEPIFGSLLALGSTVEAEPLDKTDVLGYCFRHGT